MLRALGWVVAVMSEIVVRKGKGLVISECHGPRHIDLMYPCTDLSCHACLVHPVQLGEGKTGTVSK